jgi:hypothetical protein
MLSIVASVVLAAVVEATAEGVGEGKSAHPMRTKQLIQARLQKLDALGRDALIKRFQKPQQMRPLIP